MTIGIMEVTLLRAHGLKNTDFFGNLDPYVLIQYKNQEQKSQTGGGKAYKSRINICCMCLKGHGSDAVWNEKFKFKVEYPIRGDEGNHEHSKLILKIMDKETFTQDHFVGQATISLKELIEIGVEKGIARLPNQKYRVVSADQTYNGEIQVGITFVAREESNQLQE